MVEQLIRLIVHSRSLLRPPRTSKLLDRSLSPATRPPQRYLTNLFFFNGFLQRLPILTKDVRHSTPKGVARSYLVMRPKERTLDREGKIWTQSERNENWWDERWHKELRMAQWFYLGAWFSPDMTHRSDKEEKLDLLADVTHRSNKKEVFNLELTTPSKQRGVLTKEQRDKLIKKEKTIWFIPWTWLHIYTSLSQRKT